MLDLSFRVTKDTTRARQEEIIRRMRVAYETYAVTNPYRESPRFPPIMIEAFPSDRPYTEHGTIRGALWLGEKVLDRWTQNAVKAVMRALLEEFPDRGVSFLYDNDGSALKLQPKRSR